MINECAENAPEYIKIEVTASECPKMPKGDVLIIEGPALNYAKSGPVCITALNAMYPWITLTRDNVKTPALDFDEENNKYHCVCPCGIVSFDITSSTWEKEEK